tara:strand:+ start:63 stop:620 length:558 start_codon:yes stop_codon:yes gene_type:complete
MLKFKTFLKKNSLIFSKLIEYKDVDAIKIHKICNILKKIKKNNKVHVFGNGGSSTIASHFSMDITNNSKIKCFAYNDPSIITCFANDFRFENWISKVLSKYGEKKDVLLIISSSGESKNVINGIKTARKKSFSSIITFTGFKKNNKVNKLGDLNFWVNSKNYNTVEAVHNYYLLTIVDLLKRKLN